MHEVETGHWHVCDIGVAAGSTCEKWSVGDVRSAISDGVVFYTCDCYGTASLISPYDCFCGYRTVRTPVDAVPGTELDELRTCDC